MNRQSIPLGLYIHLPWCLKKCPYCDFNSHEATAPPFERYVDALLADLRSCAEDYAGRTLQTIFIGGGTPSLFPGAAIARLLTGVRALAHCAGDIEITLEANPGAADAERFAAYLEAGVNRLSIGVQSFDDGRLAALGRVHDAQAANAAVLAARAAGCRRINIDLMYGLPRSAPGDALTDLETAIALEPEHVSWYQLTLEPGTAFARKPPVLPDDDALADEIAAGIRVLAAAGYDRYEVSAFARAGEQARHNLNYWRFGDYLGIGAGAHGKLTRESGVFRTAKRRSPIAYLSRAGAPAAADDSGPVAAPDLVAEFALNALRLREGYPEPLFEQRTGLAAHHIEPCYRLATSRGLLERGGGRVRASALGYRFLNDLQSLFLPPEDA